MGGCGGGSVGDCKGDGEEDCEADSALVFRNSGFAFVSADDVSAAFRPGSTVSPPIVALGCG